MSQGTSHTHAEKELFYSRFGFSVILTDCRCAMRVLLQEHQRPRCSDTFGSASPCRHIRPSERFLVRQ